ncbi:MAG: hypothetical protein JXA11_00770 [Phycisphaerae bacterium]|nr:hypothetical protein [Phycisphaerae bacterium]
MMQNNEKKRLMPKMIAIGIFLILIAGFIGSSSVRKRHPEWANRENPGPAWMDIIQEPDFIALYNQCKNEEPFRIPEDYVAKKKVLVVEFHPDKKNKPMLSKELVARYARAKQDASYTLFIVEHSSVKAFDYIGAFSVGHQRTVHITVIEIPEKKKIGKTYLYGEKPPGHFKYSKFSTPPKIIYGKPVPEQEILKAIQKLSGLTR